MSTFIDKIKAVDTDRYPIRVREMREIKDYTDADPVYGSFGMVALAYNYGFMRGQGAEKNRRKK